MRKYEFAKRAWDSAAIRYMLIVLIGNLRLNDFVLFQKRRCCMLPRTMPYTKNLFDANFD